jgi:hypothetical protein
MYTYTVSYAGVIEERIESPLATAKELYDQIVSGAPSPAGHYSPGMHIAVTDATGARWDGSNEPSLQKVLATRSPSDYPYRLRVICAGLEEVVFSDYPAWAYKGWVLEGNPRVQPPAGYVKGATPVEVIDASESQEQFAALRAAHKPLELQVEQAEQKLAALCAEQKKLELQLGKTS